MGMYVHVLQGRLPEIEVLQKQISKAHEELSDLRFKLEEQRAAASSKEQQLNTDKQQLQSQVGSWSMNHCLECLFLYEIVVGWHERLELHRYSCTTGALQVYRRLTGVKTYMY
jgi:predicted  nucleic acid-binding Zn-ribbon protein